jgi:hypothetical protein
MPFSGCPDQDDGPQTPPKSYLALRKWTTIPTISEFRCFVLRENLVAISQRDHTNYYPELAEMVGAIEIDILDFFEENIKGKFAGGPDYTFDVFRPQQHTVKLVDFNPFHPTTDALLFDWRDIVDSEEGRLANTATAGTGANPPHPTTAAASASGPAGTELGSNTRSSAQALTPADLSRIMAEDEEAQRTARERMVSLQRESSAAASADPEADSSAGLGPTAAAAAAEVAAGSSEWGGGLSDPFAALAVAVAENAAALDAQEPREMSQTDHINKSLLTAFLARLNEETVRVPGDYPSDEEDNGEDVFALNDAEEQAAAAAAAAVAASATESHSGKEGQAEGGCDTGGGVVVASAYDELLAAAMTGNADTDGCSASAADTADGSADISGSGDANGGGGGGGSISGDAQAVEGEKSSFITHPFTQDQVEFTRVYFKPHAQADGAAPTKVAQRNGGIKVQVRVITSHSDARMKPDVYATSRSVRADLCTTIHLIARDCAHAVCPIEVVEPLEASCRRLSPSLAVASVKEKQNH